MPDIFVSPSENLDSTIKPAIKDKKSRSSSFFSIFGSKQLSAFMHNPSGICFETQGKSEKIVLLLRRHIITNFTWILASIFLILIPIFLLPLLNFLGFPPKGFPVAYIHLIIFIWYSWSFSYLLVNFLVWYFTVSIVTNERIIDIDFVNILHKEFSATKLSKIEDVTMKRGGFIRALFDFGDVFVQTAGTETNFEFSSSPYPEQVVQIINQLMSEG